MGTGRKIEDWFDRKIAQSRDLDKLPGEVRKSVSDRIKFPSSRSGREEKSAAEARETAPRDSPSSRSKSRPVIKDVREARVGERFSNLKKKLPIPDLKKPLQEKREDVEEKVAPTSRYDMIRTGDFADIIVENPIPALGIMVLLTLFFFFQAVSINMADFPVPFDNNLNIHGETTVYLPTEHETSEILGEVREYWSTDIIVVFVQINDPENNQINITNPDILNEISYVEETLDPDKDDRGEKDGIIYCFSISTLIKEVNSTAPRAYNATLINLADLIDTYGPRPPEETLRQYINIDPVGQYSIPSDRNVIDSIANNIDENARNVREKIVRDTNNDTIWDTAVIVMGVHEKHGDDPKEIIALSERVVAERPTQGNPTTFTVTGPLPLTDYATEKAFYYYGILMPLAIWFLVGAILVFHRSLKAVFIAGIPTGASVVWIYGLLAMFNVIVTPTIIILGPVLLALGMSYGMHIANRFAQETDPSFTERGRITLKTTGNAVLMSAITTMVGFFSLAFGDLKPVTTVGWSLTGGILFCFLLTYIMSPTLCILLKYEKKTIKAQGATWKKIGKIPVNNSKKILIFFAVVILLSISMYPLVEKDTDLMSYAPNRDTEWWGTPIDGFDKIEVMKTYSEEFDSGALGMTVIEGQLRSNDYDNDGEDPVEVLRHIERMEDGINDIVKEHPDIPVNAIGLVSIMRSIGLEGSIGTSALGFPFDVDFSESTNFWAILNTPVIDDYKPIQKFLLNVFYDSLSDEAKGMVINQFEDRNRDDYYRKTLIYVDMPVLSDKEAHIAVDEVNEVVHPEDEGPMYYNHGDDTKATKLTGVAAIAVATNDLLIDQQVFSLALSILLVLIVLSLIFKSPKLGLMTTVPVVMIIGFQPMVMVFLGVPLNLATVMIGSSVIGAGVDFSVHITQRMYEKGLTKQAIQNSVEKAGPALFEATIITLAGLCSAFFVPMPAVFTFIAVIMVLLLLAAVAALFILPSIFTVYVTHLETKEAIGQIVESEPTSEWDVEWDVD